MDRKWYTFTSVNVISKVLFSFTEKWDFPNPCTRKNLDMNITKFVHPYDTSKFLMCGEMGKLYIVQCPQREVGVLLRPYFFISRFKGIFFSDLGSGGRKKK